VWRSGQVRAGRAGATHPVLEFTDFDSSQFGSLNHVRRHVATGECQDKVRWCFVEHVHIEGKDGIFAKILPVRG